MVYRQTPRSQRVRAASRARMLSAARKLFARRGYGATTMRDIAKAANTSIGNLYFYFEHKDELLGTLLVETRGSVWVWAEKAAASLPPGPARLAISTYANLLRLATTDLDLMRVVVTEGFPPRLSERSVGEHQANLRALLRENLPDYPEVDLEMALATWNGALRRCAERYARGELGTDPVAVAEFLVRWNLRGVGVAAAEIEAAISVAAWAVRDAGSPLLPARRPAPPGVDPGVERRR